MRGGSAGGTLLAGLLAFFLGAFSVFVSGEWSIMGSMDGGCLEGDGWLVGWWWFSSWCRVIGRGGLRHVGLGFMFRIVGEAFGWAVD